jgi:hypothetical protein
VVHGVLRPRDVDLGVVEAAKAVGGGACAGFGVGGAEGVLVEEVDGRGGTLGCSGCCSIRTTCNRCAPSTAPWTDARCPRRRGCAQ